MPPYAIAPTYTVVGLLLRIALMCVYAPSGSGIGNAVVVSLSGIVLDLLVSSVTLTPLTLLLALSGGGSLAGPRLRYALLTLFSSAMIFGAAVEWFFFDEFTARFNHIAVDYVLFPGEVFTNIWESYNVPLYSAMALALGAAVAWPAARWLRGATFAPLPVNRRLVGAAVTLVTVTIAVVVLMLWPAALVNERQVAEIAQNGLVQLVRAFATAHLDYDTYYRTLPPDEATTVAQSLVNAPGGEHSFTKHFPPTYHP